ncbi:MAG: SUMF1/EgtB/PvdO family nonheme iron enzyme [Nitrospirae bacterium]|nr:SUMF1/EgtB/PvdO family nonheme iron enzyme [Nitrospirota bacterium]
MAQAADRAGLREIAALFAKRRLVIPAGALLLIAAVVAIKRLHAPLAPTPASDDSEMVEIPGGRFLMGSDGGFFDERPVHAVTLRPFEMARYEVTYEQYRRFVEETPAWRKGSVETDLADLDYLADWDGLEFPAGKGSHPVVYVSWHAAAAYAEWARRALPTEAQWEYAGRGGADAMDYPWGPVFQPHLVRGGGAEGHIPPGAIRIGSYAMNGFGVNDMAGNVSEWTADGYELYREADEDNPHVRINRHLKVVRGGSWKSADHELRVSARQRLAPNATRDDLGFRCVSAGP